MSPIEHPGEPCAARLDCEVVVTRSGVIAMRDRASGEVMHPMGPAVEAHAVYVSPSGLEARLSMRDAAGAPGAPGASRGPGANEPESPLVLFDVGLGAGSNAIAAWQVSESLPPSARRLEIVSFEHDMSALWLALETSHAEAFGLASPTAHAAASAVARDGHHSTARTSWRLCFGDVLVALAREPDACADIVFWDMFSRGVNPELWTTSTFRALRRVCRAGATVHTYNAATSTRSGLLLADFAVGVGEPTGDRGETTVAAVDLSALARPLDARWLERLTRSSAPFPTDVTDDSDARAAAHTQIRRHPQFQRA